MREDTWFMFNDNIVTPVSLKQAMTAAFGGAHTSFSMHEHYFKGRPVTSNTSAYKLIYIKESDMNWFTKEAPTEMIPRHLQQKFDREQEAIIRIDYLLAQQNKFEEILIFTREQCKMWD